MVPPDHAFDKTLVFELGGVRFEVRHAGPAHAPGDSIMLLPDYHVLFSGDVIYKGRVPFLDSPQTDTVHWLAELDTLTRLTPVPRFVIPGHGDPSPGVVEAIAATRDSIHFVRARMRAAVNAFVPFERAYAQTDWSEYAHLPAFDASNRGNAYRIYLEMEAALF